MHTKIYGYTHTADGHGISFPTLHGYDSVHAQTAIYGQALNLSKDGNSFKNRETVPTQYSIKTLKFNQLFKED